MSLFGLQQDCRRKIGVLAVRARKETQIRNNHFYPEVRKSGVYEIILLSSIILTKILIWGPRVLEQHCVGKCLSVTFQSSSSRRKLIFCASFLEKRSCLKHFMFPPLTPHMLILACVQTVILCSTCCPQKKNYQKRHLTYFSFDHILAGVIKIKRKLQVP